MNAVDIYIARFNEAEQRTAQYIRGLILNAAPYITERFKYNVPFFYGRSSLCYLNFDGKAKSFYIGFIKGHQLSDHYGVLKGTDLKQVRYFYIKDFNSHQESLFLDTLNEALLLENVKI